MACLQRAEHNMAKVVHINGMNGVTQKYLLSLFSQWVLLILSVLSVVIAHKVSVLLYLAPVPFLLCYRYLRKNTALLRSGSKGERETLKLLKRLPKNYYILPDLTLVTAHRKSQVDFLILCPKGIYTIEAKNVAGEISGKADSNRLYKTRPVGRGKYERKPLYNPLKQAEGHVATIQEMLQENGITLPVCSVIYFSNRYATLKTDFGDRPVFCRKEDGDKRMLEFLMSHGDTIWRKEAMEQLVKLVAKYAQ